MPETETQEVRKTEDGKYVLKFGDEERQVDEKELVRLAHLSHGAGRKFEEASQLRKDAETAAESKASEKDREWRELVRKADAGDAVSYAKVLEMTVEDEAERNAKLDFYKAAWSGNKGGNNGNGNRNRRKEEDVNEEPETLPLDKMPEEIQQLVSTLGTAKTARLLERLDSTFKEKDRNDVYDATWKDVAANEELAKIVSKGGPRAEKLRKLSDTLIKGRIRDGEQYSPKLREAVVEELRGLAKEFGTGGTSDNPLPNIGLAPSLSHIGSQAGKEPERKPITELDYSESVIRRMAHKLMRS